MDTKLYKMKGLRFWNSYYLYLLICVILVFYSNPDNSWAKVEGKCSNCHTMHNSQDGDPNTMEDPNLNVYLLTKDCVGCHSSSDPAVSKDPITGAPIVYTKGGPPEFGARYGSGDRQGLAGGNFYWVGTGDDNKGHNIFKEDKELSEGAPGNLQGGGCTNSCHTNLNEPFKDIGGTPGLDRRQGCTGCHMVDDYKGPKSFHHADVQDGKLVIDDFPWYRFLKGHQGASNYGVEGIEDSDWQKDPNKHNEYLGKYVEAGNYSGFLSLSNQTMTSFCCGCHGNFHVQEPEEPELPGEIWFRHPSDSVIPDLGEYAAYKTYNPEAPVARPREDLHILTSTGPSDIVTPGRDMVMCLSCHRAHGSPYPDMLRWDYTEMIAGEKESDGSGGCFICHTKKVLAP